MDKRTQELLSDPILPLLLRKSAPNTVSFLIQSIVTMAEVWFIAKLGINPLAAVALAFPLLMLTQTMSGGALGGAINSAIARSLGSGDVARAQKLLWHAILISVSGAVLFLVMFLLAGRPFLAWLGGEGQVLEESLLYARVVFIGGIAFWLAGSLQSVFRGMGNMRFPAALTIASSCIQIILSGGLILGWFGLPKLGLIGAALSPVIAASFMSLVMLTKLVGSSVSVQLRFDRCKFEKSLFQDIFVVFLPASLSPVTTVATVLVLTGLVAQFGTTALAGYGIGSRVEFLMIPLVFGIGTSMTAMVGANKGAKNIVRAEKIGWTGGFLALCLSGIVGILLAIFPDVWIKYLTDDQAILVEAKQYIQIVGFFYGFQGLGLSLYFASQGASAMKWPVVATMTRFLVVCVGGLFVTYSIFDTIQAVYIFAALAMASFGTINAIALKMGAWRR
ncbi:MAG: MATE family efflux transporter [Dehalococcoidia bacterium]|nr:MATE family efflux transporter [Dehalococcoidia bacterium]